MRTSVGPTSRARPGARRPGPEVGQIPIGGRAAIGHIAAGSASGIGHIMICDRWSGHDWS
eukprot:2631598-Lingulodinium_polyedra.AAC.1